MANASSEPAVEAEEANDAVEVTGAGEFEFQKNGKLSFDSELLRIVSVEPAVEEMPDRSKLTAALLAVTSFSKCVTWAIACVGNKNRKVAAPKNAPLKKLANLQSSGCAQRRIIRRARVYDPNILCLENTLS